MGLFFCSMLAAISLLAPLDASTRSTVLFEKDAVDSAKFEDIRVENDPRQRYLLHSPGKEGKDPASGWRVLVVMPGGDGSAEFAPFVGRIRENALPSGWLIAEIVAPQWDEKQGETIVWPTEKAPYREMKFSTEKLFDLVLDDLAKRRKLDLRYVFTLSWSSSGPAAYTLALASKTRITGSFIAMSVFVPERLPSLDAASGRAFYILHSPEDKIPIRMAERARDELKKNGAFVEYSTYEGGHGWHGDVFAEIGKGVRWLEKAAGKATKPKK